MQDLISQYERDELTQNLLRERRLLSADHQAYLLYLQVFFPNPNESEKVYTEERSHKVLLVPSEWQQITVDIPDFAELRKHPLRLDPLNTMGMIWISALHLVNAITGKLLWSASDETGFSGCEEILNLLLIERTEVLMLASIGTDPIMKLPIMDELPEVPLRLKIWIKVDRNLLTLSTAWRVRDASLKTKEQEILVRQQHTNDLENQLNAMAETHKLMESKNKKLTSEIETQVENIQERNRVLGELESENKKLTSEIETQAKSIQERDNALEELESENKKLIHEVGVRENNIQECDRTLEELESENKKLTHEVEVRENNIQERDRALEELKSENKKLTHEVEVREKNIQERDRVLGGLESENKKLVNEVEAQGKSIQERDNALEELKSENKKLIHKVEVRAKNIQERDRTLEALESENKKLTRETEIQAKSIEERFQELAVLTKMLEKNEGDLQAQERNVTVYQQRVNGLESELGEKSEALNAAKMQLAETKAQLNKVQEATDSVLAMLRLENKELKSELQIQAKKLEDCFKELTMLTRLLVERDSASPAKEGETSIGQQSANKPSQEKSNKRWWESSFTIGLKQFVWAKLIEKSGLFDSEWYLKQYPDVVKHKGGPIDHYIRRGAAEGRNPGPEFDTAAYLRKYPDVANIGINPLVHYVQYGKAEGRTATKFTNKEQN